MIKVLDTLTYLLSWGYSFVFFWLLKTFLPLRKNRFMVLAGFCVCHIVADFIIYSNDLANLLGSLLLFCAYVFVFHRGMAIEKISVVLVFYPAMVAINYLMTDAGSRLFFAVKRSAFGETLPSSQIEFIEAVILMATLILRLLFWIGAWLVLRRFLGKITSRLNLKTWLIVDMLMLASFVAVFTIIYFMPRDTAIVYPICGAAVFSSFGCMYLASYICESMQTAYRVQELEMQKNYYQDRIKDEERVRSIYHDLKNYLLILQSEAEDGGERARSAKMLQSRIEGYENYQQTGNQVLDIVIRDKAKLAQEKKIDFRAAVTFEDGSFLEPLDIGTIFGNALDNAIEASEKLPEEERLITVKADRVRDILMIVVENNASAGVPAEGKTSKEDKFLHGLGLPNIRKAVERYEGQLSTKMENGIFKLKIMIPIP